MSGGLSFNVAAWAAWRPDEFTASAAALAGRTLPALLRRRATAIGRRALDAAWAVLPAAGPEPRIVLSSRHGEYARTLGLLTGLAEEGTVSPAEFSMAVHHSLTGLLSIAAANHAGHSAVAAGRDSFGYGLLEAAACLAESGQPVVALYFDEPLPEEYRPVADAPAAALVLALALVPGEEMTLDLGPGEGEGAEPQAAVFLDFLAAGRGGATLAGERMTWRLTRA